MRIISMVLALLCVNLNSMFAQSKANIFPYDFLKYNAESYCFSVSSGGELYFRSYYKSLKNEFGNAKVHMIHKNGGDWWQKRALEKYPKYPRTADKKAAKALCQEDSSLLKEFNIYAFYIDKKYLKREFHGCGDSDNPKIPIDTNRCYGYYEKFPYEKILYFRAANTKEWIEIDRKLYKTDKDETLQTGYWETNFIKQKLEESNKK